MSQDYPGYRDSSKGYSNYQQYQPNLTGKGGFATTSLILGLVSILLSWTIAFGILLGILAIIFGGIVVSDNRKVPYPNNGRAVAGLVLGIVGLIVSVLFIFFYRAAADEAENSASQVFALFQ